MKTTEVISKYTKGEATLEETNAALKELGTGLTLDPQRNTLTEEDMRATTVGYYPSQVNGFGLLDTGTGSLDKVRVKDGKLVYDNVGDSFALLLIAGKVYQVKGDTLVEQAKETAGEAAPVLPKTPDMKRRTDLAGQTVEQQCKTGLFSVTYDADGYAVSAVRA